MAFTLQLLHASDQEAGVPALDDAVRFSAVLNALRGQSADLGADGTLTLSSGDAYIPSPFLLASADILDEVAGYELGAIGRGDILIQNELGFQAIAFGNHEFDLGTALVADLINASDDEDVLGVYPGTAFPYLSSNLDFSTDSELAGLVVEGGAAPQPNTISSSVVIDVEGIDFGIVGATTPTLDTISSPGGITISPDSFDATDAADIAALAAVIQAEVDMLTASGVDHIILMAHMQQIAVEKELAKLLSDVDIIMAGGSNTLLADETDVLRAGDTVGDVYPILDTSASGDPIAIVNTDGNYKYVGQLVVTFDDNGVIDPDSIDTAVSGAYATDAAGVTRVGGDGLEDPEIVAIAAALEEVIVELDGTIYGKTDVFLNGTRGSVRTEETNLGNLSADANLAYAKQIDSSVVVSIKNGGGIRDNIGVVSVPAGSTDPDDVEFLPPAANELAGKAEGDVSQLDVSNALRFNNSLSLVTVTAEGLKQVMEYAVSGVAEGSTPGSFPQVGGMSFSFDATQQAIDFDDEGAVVTPGERIQNLAIVDDNGTIIDVIVKNGEVVGDPARSIRLVTLGFLATGGDGYPFDTLGTDVVDLSEAGVRTGEATSADNGTEQDALAEYLIANFSDMPFSDADTSIADDLRIQNLAERSDAVLEGVFSLVGGDTADLLEGGSEDDTLRGKGGKDQLFGFSGNDRLVGGLKGDRLLGGNGNDVLKGGSGNDELDGGDGNDRLKGGNGNDLLIGDKGKDRLVGGKGRDQFVLRSGDESDIIVDFEDDKDTIGLVGKLKFSDLTIVDRGKGAVIKDGKQPLALLIGVEAEVLTAEDFQAFDL